jgi:hypothetical protein
VRSTTAAAVSSQVVSMPSTIMGIAFRGLLFGRVALTRQPKC